MRIALVLVVRKTPRTEEAQEVVAEQVRYHLERGVDVVVGVADDADGALFTGLGSEGRFRYVVARTPGAPEDTRRAVQVAIEQHRVDWLLESAPGELWWPRRGRLDELLAAVPERFDAVRALEREFVARPQDDGSFFERTTVRRHVAGDAAPPARLRLAWRAHVALDPEPALVLRDWYPLELLCFPMESSEALEDEAVAVGLADGSLRHDARVRDALRGEDVPAPTLAEEVELAEELESLLATPCESSLFPTVEALDRRLVALERAAALTPLEELRRLRARLRQRRLD